MEREHELESKTNADPTSLYCIVDLANADPDPGATPLEKENPYRCATCSKRFKNTQGLKYHRQHPVPCIPDRANNSSTPFPRIKDEASSDIEEYSSLSQANKKRKISASRKTPIPKTYAEGFQNLKRDNLDEALVAIGFIVDAGRVFENLARDWYALNRPAQILRTTEETDAFDLMVVSFMAKYGKDFWPEDSLARGHLTYAKAPYLPRSWFHREHISFRYPRDGLFRSKRNTTNCARIRNSTQSWGPQEQINSVIFKALKPYFLGLHFFGRQPGEEEDPDDFEDWPAQSKEQAEQWLDELRGYSRMQVPRRHNRLQRKVKTAEVALPMRQATTETLVEQHLEKRNVKMIDSARRERHREPDESDERIVSPRTSCIRMQFPMPMGSAQAIDTDIQSEDPYSRIFQVNYAASLLEMKASEIKTRNEVEQEDSIMPSVQKRE